MAELLAKPWAGWLLLLVSLAAGAAIAVLVGRVRKRFSREAPEPGAELRPDATDATLAIGLGSLHQWWRSVFPTAESSGRRATPFWLAIPAGKYMPFVAGFEAAGARVGLRDEHEYVVEGGSERGIASWAFFARGALLRLSPAFMFADDLGPAPTLPWTQVASLLVHTRPERPLEGVLLTIDVAEFLAGEGPAREALRKRGTILRERLDALQSESGMVVPIYVVVTGLHRYRGFAPFVRLIGSRREQMFGWSAPYRRDAAFEPSWIAEAMRSVAGELLEAQLAHFAATGPVNHARDIVALGAELCELETGIRDLLTPVFSNTAYGPSPMLRGIYFVGDGESAARQAPAGYAFLDGLLEDKVFAEVGLAQLKPKEMQSRRRARTGVQLASGAVLAYTLVAVIWSSVSLAPRAEALTQSLDDIEELFGSGSEVDAGACFEQPSPECVAEVEYESVHTLAQLETESLQTPLLPISMFDPVDEDITRLMRIVLDEVILWGYRLELRYRLVRGYVPRLGDELPTGTLWDLSKSRYAANLDLRLEEINDTFAPIQEFAVLTQPVETVDARLEATASLYERLLAPLPEGFLDNSDYYRDALNQLEVAPLALDDWTVLTRANYVEDHRAMLRRARIADPLLARLQEIDGGWLLLGSGKSTVAGLAELGAAIDEAAKLLASSNYTWVFASPSSESADPLRAQSRYTKRLEAVAASSLLGKDVSEAMAEDGDEIVDSLRQDILAFIAGPRPSLANNEGRGGLSPAIVEDIEPAIDEFLALDFVARVPKDNLCGEIRVSTSTRWDLDRLRDAALPYSEYRDYVETRLATVPVDIRGTLEDLAGEALLLTLCERLVRAAGRRSGTVANNDDAAALADNFAILRPPLTTLAEAFDEIEAPREAAIVWTIVDTAAVGVLEAADREWSALNPYATASVGLSGWAGDGTPAYSIFSRYSPEGIAEYLELQREALRTLVRDVGEDPLAYLETRDEWLSPTYEAAYQRWATRRAAFDSYDAGTVQASLRVLENFIQNTMAVTNADECIASVPAKLDSTARDEFYNRAESLRRALRKRCREIIVSEAKLDYESVRKSFATLVAGKFPFADEGAPAAAWLDVETLLIDYQQFRARHQVVLDGGVGWQPSEEIEAFFTSMDRAIRFLGLDAVDGHIDEAEIVIAVGFGAPNKGLCSVIEWSMTMVDGEARQSVEHGTNPDARLRWAIGRKLEVDARWARDAPSQPRRASGGTVGSSGRVHFEFTDDWALLRLFARHGELDEGVYARELSLPVVVERPANRAPAICGPQARVATVELELELELLGGSGEGRLELPLFPRAAPKTLTGAWAS